MYKNERFELRMTTTDLALLDRLRGSATRSAYVRNLILRAAEARDHDGPKRLIGTPEGEE